MPNVPIVTARKIITVIKKKGFVYKRSKGSHQIYIRFSDQKSVSIPIHSGKDLGRGITRSILKDADISLEEFLKLI